MSVALHISGTIIIWSWLMVCMCKMIISPWVFLQFFQILFLRSIVGQKSKKWPEMTNYVCWTPYLSKHTSYDCVFCCTSLKWWHLQMLFSFFQNLIFWVVRWEGVKRAKMAQNHKIFCLTLYLRNCTSYDHGFWYTCEMISPAIFFIFSSLIFQVFQSSSINAKKKFSDMCPPASQVCDFLFFYSTVFTLISLKYIQNKAA